MEYLNLIFALISSSIITIFLYRTIFSVTKSSLKKNEIDRLINHDANINYEPSELSTISHCNGISLIVDENGQKSIIGQSKPINIGLA
jgi:hypothetical protein